MSAVVPFDTARTRVRAAAAADLDPLHAIATDPRVAPMLLKFRAGMPREALAALFPPGADRPPLRAVVEMDGQVIGSIGCGAGPRAPFYYFLAPALSGRGLGGEIVAGFLAAIDAARPVEALVAEVFADNPASLAILARNGFGRVAPVTLSSAARPGPAPGWRLDRPVPPPTPPAPPAPPPP